MPKIQQEFVCIGGWSFNQPPGPKRIVLMRGNRHGEEIVKTLEHLPPTTTWDQACKLSDEYATKLGIRVGRAFNKAERNGLVKAEGPYVPDPVETH